MGCSRRTERKRSDTRTGAADVSQRDRLLRRHPQRPRCADARPRARRRGRRADARLRPPHHRRSSATARSSRSTRPRRCSSAARAGSATSTSTRRVVVSASTGEGLRLARRAGGGRHGRVRLGLPHRRRPRRPAAAPRRRCSRAAPRRVAIAPAELPPQPRSPTSTGSGCWPRPATRPRSRPPATWPTRSGPTSSRDERQRRPAGRRLTRRGARGPRDDQRAGAERDRERDRPVLVAARGVRSLRTLVSA